MDGTIEIVTGRERRRRWSAEEKLRLVAEMQEPGAVVRAVAARHGVCESLLFTWRRQAQSGLLAAPREVSVFMPVQMIHEAPSSIAKPTDSATPPRPTTPSGLIEIELSNGQHVRVGSDVNFGRSAAYAGGAARMIPIATGIRVWIATGHTDMRRGMRGLALQVQEGLGRDPFAGDVFVFRGRNGSLIRRSGMMALVCHCMLSAWIVGASCGRRPSTAQWR